MLPTPAALAVLFTGRIETTVILVVTRVLRDHDPRAGGQPQPGEEEQQGQQHRTLCISNFLSVDRYYVCLL